MRNNRSKLRIQFATEVRQPSRERLHVKIFRSREIGLEN
jgi:hypothetical protein